MEYIREIVKRELLQLNEAQKKKNYPHENNYGLNPQINLMAIFEDVEQKKQYAYEILEQLVDLYWNEFIELDEKVDKVMNLIAEWELNAR